MRGEKDDTVSGDRLNRVKDALSRWSGLPPSKHLFDAVLIMTAEMFPNENPRRSVEQLEKIRKAAAEIERAVSAMSQPDQIHLFMGMSESWFAQRYPPSIPRDEKDYIIPRDEKDNVDQILSFSRKLQDGAKHARRSVEERLEVHPDSKNENRFNTGIAMAVAIVYTSITGREPPKAGADGPFQRLLREVYEAIGRPDVDLRGPLRKVHESRKNRHS